MAKEKLERDNALKRPIVMCGLIAPIASIEDLPAQHWENIKRLLQEALETIEEYDFRLDLVSYSEASGVITGRIVKNIFENELVICDVSCLNPNVMLELGLRLSTKKPTIIIKDIDTRFIFDITTIEHIVYPRSLHYTTIQKFKSDFASKVLATFNEYKESKHKSFLDYYAIVDIAKLNHSESTMAVFIANQFSELKTELAIRPGIIANPTVTSNYTRPSPQTYNSNRNHIGDHVQRIIADSEIAIKMHQESLGKSLYEFSNKDVSMIVTKVRSQDDNSNVSSAGVTSIVNTVIEDLKSSHLEIGTKSI